jgi:hypothetical protein
MEYKRMSKDQQCVETVSIIVKPLQNQAKFVNKAAHAPKKSYTLIVCSNSESSQANIFFIWKIRECL